jgi:hypothetical protein
MAKNFFHGKLLIFESQCEKKYWELEEKKDDMI